MAEQLYAREILNKDGQGGAVFLSNPTEMKTEPAQSELIFDVVGGKKFLAEVFEKGEVTGIQLNKSRREKELEEVGDVATTVAVPFSHGG